MAKSILKKKQKIKVKSKKSALMQFLILAIASAFFFALTFLLRKQAGRFIPVTTAYFIETVIQLTLITFAFFLFAPEAKHGFSFQSIKGYGFAALTGIAVVVGVLLSYLALRMGFLSKYQAITAPAQIVFAALLGLSLSGEIFTVRQIFGSIVAIAGILLIILK